MESIVRIFDGPVMEICFECYGVVWKSYEMFLAAVRVDELSGLDFVNSPLGSYEMFLATVRIDELSGLDFC